MDVSTFFVVNGAASYWLYTECYQLWADVFYFHSVDEGSNCHYFISFVKSELYLRGQTYLK